MMELLNLLEAYLFIAAEPVQPDEVAKIIGADSQCVKDTLEEIYSRYEHSSGGLQIIRLAGGYQMATRPALAGDLARLLAAPGAKARLSKPALETLAIVAYQQPVTQAEVEAVRGVSVDGVLKTLTDRDLIQEEGRKAVPGRPILYGTTKNFLHHFGLNHLDDLPPLEEFSVPDTEAEKAAHDALEAVGLEDKSDD